MTGVKFVVDERGRKTAVQLDLEVWGDLWEDIYDAQVVRERQHEETLPWAQVRDSLLKDNDPE